MHCSWDFILAPVGPPRSCLVVLNHQGVRHKSSHRCWARNLFLNPEISSPLLQDKSINALGNQWGDSQENFECGRLLNYCSRDVVALGLNLKSPIVPGSSAVFQMVTRFLWTEHSSQIPWNSHNRQDKMSIGLCSSDMLTHICEIWRRNRMEPRVRI
jgi:hypothetical protein